MVVPSPPHTAFQGAEDEGFLDAGRSSPQAKGTACSPRSIPTPHARAARDCGSSGRWPCASFPDDHPAYSHLTECSPCYREYRGIQQTESFLWTWRFRLSRAARGACASPHCGRLRHATVHTMTRSHSDTAGPAGATAACRSAGERQTSVTRCSLDRGTSQR